MMKIYPSCTPWEGKVPKDRLVVDPDPNKSGAIVYAGDGSGSKYAWYPYLFRSPEDIRRFARKLWLVVGGFCTFGGLSISIGALFSGFLTGVLIGAVVLVGSLLPIRLHVARVRKLADRLEQLQSGRG